MAASYVRRSVLRFYPGDDRAFTWGPMLDDAGDALNLVEWSALAQVRPMLGGGVLHEWSTEDGSITLTEGGHLTLKVDDSETWTWTGGRFDIHLTDPNGKTQVIDSGTAVVDRGVTVRA